MGADTVRMGPPTAKPIAGGFQFITSINTIKRDDETRRKVRSHARRQKLPNDTTAPQAVVGPVSQKERTTKFRLSAVANQHGSSGNAVTTVTTTASGGRKQPQAAAPSRAVRKPSPTSSDGSGAEVKVERMEEWETEMITPELGFTIARELKTFATLPIQTTPLTENLFKYIICVCLSPQEKFVQKWFDRCGAPTYFNTYHSSFLANSHAMNPHGNWFDTITVDPAMTHAFMGLIAAMHNALAEWHDTTTIDFHRYAAVKYINTRLNLEGKNPNMPISDGVIISVSLLLTIEAFIGSIASAKAHMNGLKQMVDMRGGLLVGFGYSTLIQRALSWADFAYATASGTPLSFPFVPQLASSLGINDRFMSRSLVINTQPARLSPHDLTVKNREALEIFELLYSITMSVNGFDFEKLETLRGKRVQMCDCIYLVEWRLCKLEELARSRSGRTRAESLPLGPSGATGIDSNEEALAAQYNSPTDLSDALIYASHLFLHMAIRGQPPGARRHKALVEALITSISGTLASLDLLRDPTAAPASSTLATSPSDSLDMGSGRSSMDTWSTPTSDHSDASPAAPPIEFRVPQEKDDLHDDILLWILFIGSCSRVPSPAPGEMSTMVLEAALFGGYRAFFLTALNNFCHSRLIFDLDTLTARLKSIVWLDAWCERQLEMAWSEMSIASALAF